MNGFSLGLGLGLMMGGAAPSFESLGGVALDIDPALLIPGAVNTLLDASGNARNWDCTGHAPTAEAAGGPNGAPDIRFAAAKWGSLGGSPFAALTAMDLFVVWKVDTDAGSNTPWLLGTGTNDFYAYSGDGHVYLGAGSNTRRNAGNPAQDLTAWHLLRITSTSSEYTVAVGDEALYTDPTNAVAFPATAQLGTCDSGVSSLAGNVARLVMFDHKLSVPDLATTKAIFRSRFGAIPGT